jgi:hypothetical protein
LGHELSFPILRHLNMIIDETVLIQAYATVLVGVIIFLTLQRRFEFQGVFELWSGKLRLQRDDVMEERKGFEAKLENVKTSREELSGGSQTF